MKFTVVGLEPGAQRVLTTPADMMERAGDMKDLQFKDLMDPSEHFKVVLHEVSLIGCIVCAQISCIYDENNEMS